MYVYGYVYVYVYVRILFLEEFIGCLSVLICLCVYTYIRMEDRLCALSPIFVDVVMLDPSYIQTHTQILYTQIYTQIHMHTSYAEELHTKTQN